MNAVTSISPLADWQPASAAPQLLTCSATTPVHVSLFRSLDNRDHRDRFVCDLVAWELLLQVAVSFGWDQHGTTYVGAGFPTTKHRARTEPVARHDYQPGDARDSKCVESVDAIAWASALSAAQRSPHLASMLEATISTASGRSGTRWATGPDSPFLTVMEGFTAYAFAGAFEFARAEVR
ncbi:hypothetical protein [Povalibacter sp.]|uniref:hypothetical protein n=1 Tax=Povalibacter sp. TaxID=1962978 RepID=UPI002F3E9D69